MIKRLIATLLAAHLLGLPAQAQSPASVGQIKICKKDKPEDYGDPKFWGLEVVVPIGIEFRDVGPIDDVTADWIRLKIVTMQPLSLKGKTRCGVVKAMIPSNQGELDLGRKPVGQWVRRSMQSEKGLDGCSK